MQPTSTKPTTLIAMRHGGTHLIQPLIRVLTDKPVYVPKGENALTCVPSNKLVIFLRDPRNRAISHFRYKNSKAKPGGEDIDERLAKMLSSSKGGGNPVEFMLRWAGRWANEQSGYTMRFEQLLDDPHGQTTSLRDYLDAPGSVDEAIRYTIGKSGTYSGRHSRWREWFGPLSRQVWKERGGDRLVKLMGYGK